MRRKVEDEITGVSVSHTRTDTRAKSSSIHQQQQQQQTYDAPRWAAASCCAVHPLRSLSLRQVLPESCRSGSVDSSISSYLAANIFPLSWPHALCPKAIPSITSPVLGKSFIRLPPRKHISDLPVAIRLRFYSRSLSYTSSLPDFAPFHERERLPPPRLQPRAVRR